MVRGVYIVTGNYACIICAWKQIVSAYLLYQGCGSKVIFLASVVGLWLDYSHILVARPAIIIVWHTLQHIYTVCQKSPATKHLFITLAVVNHFQNYFTV